MITIIGNGPSTKGLDFDRLTGTTACLNAAYKQLERMNWAPSLYGVFDPMTQRTHTDGLAKFMDANPKTMFYVCRHSSRLARANYVNFQCTWHSRKDIPKNLSSFYDCHDTGATMCLLAMYLGFKDIRLIGIDANNTLLKEAVHVTGEQFRLKQDVEKNPNYWFDSYLEDGDVFNRPNPQSKDTWRNIAVVAEKNGVEITNYSSVSEVDCFPVKDIEEIYA